MAKMPNFAPLEAPMLVCGECSSRMRLKIEKYPNGKIKSLTYFCDTCEYGFVSSMAHHNGQMVKHEPPATAQGSNAQAKEDGKV